MNNDEFTIREAIWPADRALLRQVREPVFVEEQGVPLEMEWDDDDVIAYHLIALDSAQRPIGAARLLGSGQIGRMAVLSPWRGRGVGLALLERLVEIAGTSGVPVPFLNAQTQAIAFYRRAGFHSVGEEFYEAGIPHFRMELDE